jgi:aspartyl protease family protein
MTRRLLPLALLIALLCPLGALAQTAVALQGMLGSKALLMVGGGTPRLVAPGETWQGITVVSTSGNQAVLLIDGQRVTLRVGDTPASIGGEASPGTSDRVALTADARGHFVTLGSINNRPVQFMVDTGASMLSLSQAEADRLGLDYKSGSPVSMTTANGTARGWQFKVQSVRLGDVVVYNVDAVVTPAPMPTALLGNSFLSRFDMRRNGDQMLLVRR